MVICFLGLELIFLTTCNFGWTVNLTAERLISVQKESYNSVLAIAFGMLHVFRLTSSLYHLVLLGIHRVYAILYPIHFRRQTAKAKSAYVGILIVWFGAIIAAVAPGKTLPNGTYVVTSYPLIVH